MKILLAHKFWKKVGGAEVYFQDTARILRNYGHDVRIYTTEYDPGGGKDVFTYDKDSVTFGYATDYLKGGIIDKIRNVPETIYSKKNKELFTELLRSFKPDIVHVFAIYVTITPSILEACRENGVPVVMSCNDYKHICPNYRLFHHGSVCEDCKGGKFYNTVLNNCCKHSFAVSFISMIEAYFHEWKDIWRRNISSFLFESEFMMNKTKEFWDGKQVRLRFLGKPFDATKYEADGAYDDYLMFLGRLSDEKGVDILLKAMSLVPEAKLKIAGDGEWSDHLKALATQLDLKNVEFLGSKWGAELQELVRNCSFVVVPSVWHENFPYVMTEAFAYGKAIIGSDKGGIPEYIVPGETGYVYHSDDPEELAYKIRQMWNDKDKTIEMGSNAKEFADNTFNDQAFYTRLEGIYGEVLTDVRENNEIAV